MRELSEHLNEKTQRFESQVPLYMCQKVEWLHGTPKRRKTGYLLSQQSFDTPTYIT